MTDEQAVKCIRYLATAYPQVTLSTEAIVMYSRYLMRWPYELAQIAIDRLVVESKFFPSVAEIQNALRTLENPIPSAAVAWEEVMREIRNCGTWKTPTWSSAVIKRAVQTLGWHTLCTSENSATDRAHFLRIYSELVQVERSQNDPTLLGQGEDRGLLNESTE